MDRCTVYQSQMLEYVYDLLDEDAFGALALHLEDCAACRAALRRAREQQQLLAAAARVQFPTVRFLPPEAEVVPAACPPPQPAAAERPVVLPLVRPRRRLAWQAWASAAAVLLVLSVPAWFTLDYVAAGRALDRQETALARLNHSRQDVARQLDELERRQHDQAEALRRQAAEDRLVVQVTGNGSLQVGAPNDYALEIHKTDGRGVAMKAEVKLIEKEHNKELFSERVETGSDGVAPLPLPRRLPVEPGKSLTLRVARAESDDPRPLLEETFKLTPQAYLTHLATDRPVYRPGDTVRFRSLTVDRFSMEPAREKLALHYTMRTPQGTYEIPQGGATRLAASGLLQGASVFEPADALHRGIGSGAWEVPANFPDGEYTLTVFEARNRFPAQQRRFLVRRSDAVIAADEPAAAAAQRKLDVDFFPEGGRLVPGGRNRVYFRVRTPQGQPAALRGRLLDDLGDEVAQVETFGDAGQGLGFFWLTPYRGRKYELKIDSPTGIEGAHKLPTDQLGDVALTVPTVVTTAHEPIVARVRSAIGGRKLCVTASCRGRLFAHQCVTAHAGEDVTVRLKPGAAAGGVYRVTVFEELSEGGSRRLVPRAERLVFRQPGERLNLDVATNRDAYATGSRARMTITTRGENQQRTPAVALVAVVDQAVLGLAEDRTTRSMPTHFYLASEISNAEELEHADLLLSQHPAAPLALDLLLGTQGWRRFKEVRPGELKEGAPMLAWAPAEPPLIIGPGSDQAEKESLREKLSRAAAGFQAERQQLTARQTELDEELQEARLSPALTAAKQKYEGYRDAVAALRTLFPLLGMLLLIAAAVLLGKSLGRPVARALPYFSASAACVGLLLLGALVAFQGGPAGDSGMPAPPQTAWKHKEESETRSLGARRDRKEAVEKAAPAPSKRNADLTKADNSGARAGLPGNGKGGRVRSPAFDREGASFTPRPGAIQSRPARSPKAAYDSPRSAEGKDGKGTAPPGAPPRAPSPLPPGGAPAGGFGGGPPRLAEKGAAKRAFGKPARGQGWPAMKTKSEERADRGTDKDAGGFESRRRQANLEQLLQQGTTYFAREFAHNRRGEQDAAQRRDLSATVYWHPALVLPDGKVDVSFDLSDAVTTYQVTVFAHTADGRLAAATHTFAARKPISLEATTPTEVTAGDRLIIPLNVANLTDRPQDVRLKMLRSKEGDQKKTSAGAVLDEGKVRVEAEGQARQLYSFQPALKQGQASLEFRAASRSYADAVRRNIRVVAEGFPVVESRSDLLRGRTTQEVVLPREWVKGTLQLRLQVFPTALAEVRKGLEGLAEQPDVSFSRAAVATSPATFKKTGPDNFGYYRAVSPTAGLGGLGMPASPPPPPAPGAVTGVTKAPSFPYGPVSPSTGPTTSEVLRSLPPIAPTTVRDLDPARRFLQGTGGGLPPTTRKPGEPAYSTTQKTFDDLALGALAGQAKGDEARRLNVLAARARDSSDPLISGLAANGLATLGRKAEAVALLQKLAAIQKADGHVEPAGAGGRDQRVEATALAVLGWLRVGGGRYDASVARAVRWLGQQRDARGTFGSAPATVLALKALAADEAVHKRLREGGQVSLFAGNRLLARVPFTAQVSDALVLEVPDAEKVLKAGRNAIRIEVTGRNVLPYTLAWSYRTSQPVGAKAAPLKLAAALSTAKAAEGNRVRLTVRLENATARAQGLAVAVVGLPAGLAAPATLTGAPVSAFEVRGRELVLYWRGLAPHQKIEVPIDLTCRVPGEYRGPASRAYVAADAERKTWVAPLAITITPRGK